MAYKKKKNPLKGYLKTEKIENGKFYEFSYKFPVEKDDSKNKNSNTSSKNLVKSKDIKNDEILEYVKTYYIDEDEIVEEELINDLIIFKSYKSYIKGLVLDQEFILYGIPILIAALAVIISVFSAPSEFSGTMNQRCERFFIINFSNISEIPSVVTDALDLIFALIAVFIIIICYRVKKNSPFNNLSTVSHAIYILEEIKDNLRDEDEIPDSEDKKDEDQEIKSEDSIEITKPEDISVNTNNDNAIENEATKVEIIDYSNKSDINFIKGASCIAVLLLSIAKVFDKKKLS